MLHELLDSGSPILSGGGVEARILRATSIELDSDLGSAALLEQREGRAALHSVYAEDVDVARAHGLPAIVGTPTFRASRRYVERAGRGGAATVRRLNAEAVALLSEVRAASEHEPVLVAGVVGPYGAVDRPADCLNHLDGADYHAEQIGALVEAGADLLLAPAFPSIEEAHGAAIAMSLSGLPYAIGFALDRRGRILDATYLHAAIERLDDHVLPAPAFYSISGADSGVIRTALIDLSVTSSRASRRLCEVRANGPSPAAGQMTSLDRSTADSADAFGEAMDRIGLDFDVPVLGGCDGTDAQHLAALARRLLARAV